MSVWDGLRMDIEGQKWLLYEVVKHYKFKELEEESNQ